MSSSLLDLILPRYAQTPASIAGLPRFTWTLILSYSNPLRPLVILAEKVVALTPPHVNNCSQRCGFSPPLQCIHYCEVVRLQDGWYYGFERRLGAYVLFHFV